VAEWNGSERRNPSVYVTQEAFTDAINNVYEKLDKISERQMDHIERITRVEAIVSNGLTSTVNGLRRDLAKYNSIMQEKMDDLDKRLCVVETFAWFREWITTMKDIVFKNFVKIVIIGALLAAAAFCRWDKLIGFLR
jgi:hypothetical protein